MRRPETRHYTEEEMLLHALGEEDPEAGPVIQAHFESCHECRSVYQEYVQLLQSIHRWEAPDLSEESWRIRKFELMRMYREDRQGMRRRSLWDYVRRSSVRIWDYALANPLPTMAYVIAAVAFASERTITTFRLDRILPATTEVLKVIRQIL